MSSYLRVSWEGIWVWWARMRWWGASSPEGTSQLEPEGQKEPEWRRRQRLPGEAKARAGKSLAQELQTEWLRGWAQVAEQLSWGKDQSALQGLGFCSRQEEKPLTCFKLGSGGVWSQFLKDGSGDFPDGPVIKTHVSNAVDVGLIPGRGTKIPHAEWYGQKKKKIG